MDLENVAYLEDGDITSDGKLKIPSNKPVVVMLQGLFCGYCKKFLKDYQEAANRLKGKADMATIVIDKEKNLGKEVTNYVPGFKGVPMVVIFKNGKYSKTYDGPRKAADLIEFVNKNL